MKEKYQEDYSDIEKENQPTIPRFLLMILIVGFIAFAYLTFSGAFNNESGKAVELPDINTRPLDLVFMNQLTSAENRADINEREIHTVSGDLMQLAGNVNQIESNLNNAENKLVVLETEIGSANQRISGLESDLAEERLNVRELSNSLQEERSRSSLLELDLKTANEKVNAVSNDLQFFMLASFVFGLLLVFSLVAFAMLLFYSFVRGSVNRKRPHPNVHISEVPQQRLAATKTAPPHRQQPQVINTPVVISRKNRNNVTGYEPVITSYNDEMVSSGISLPLDSCRPPTRVEAEYMRQMSERGASKNSICSAFYGGKNSERMEFITLALNGEY